MTPPNTRRAGFTLVEILVSMVLTIFILTIMAQAFVAGSDMFRGLKAVGDLNQSLRTATNILGSDLAADHFEGKRRLSDSKFWSAPYNGPPKQGYFYLQQNPGALLALEGTDIDGVPSRRCAGHSLAFTVRARGYQPQNYFSALVPSLTIGGTVTNPLLNAIGNLGTPDGRYQLPGAFSSQWVEVSYFLNPVVGGFTANGTPLFALYRQQRLVISNNTALNWSTPIPVVSSASTPTWLATYSPKFSVQQNPNPSAAQNLYFNNPADLTIPVRRAAGVFPLPTVKSQLVTIGGVTTPVFGGATFTPITNAAGNLTGEDLLLTDVLSFEIKALMSFDTSNFFDLPVPTPSSPPAGYFLSSASPAGPGYFDTWSTRTDDVYNFTNTSTTLPNSIIPNPNSTYTILALKITIRVWDERSQVARQVTLIQEM